MEEINNIDRAIGVLIQSAAIACKRGAFELDETKVINSAIDFIKSQVDDTDDDEKQPR